MSISGDAVTEAATLSEVGSNPANAAMPVAQSTVRKTAPTAINEEPTVRFEPTTRRKTLMMLSPGCRSLACN
jgi:hypothetical protein